MAWLAFMALILWMPVVFYLFEKYPIQKAIVFAFVAAWLFLPPTIIYLVGIPDWSKMSATVVSVTLCAFMKQPQRYFSYRVRWYDLPVIVFCCCPFLSAVSSGQGAYDGLSAVLEELFRWGLPYLIGRLFLGDIKGNRQLCFGIAVGGILYIPLCLIEIRMSPQLKSWIYGFSDGRAVDFGLRYGGYRPMVFLTTGLEVGWWMCCSSLAAYQLWMSGSVKRLYGFPMSVLMILLAFVTVACKATGALVQIIIGFVLIYTCRFTKNTWLVWALMAIGPVYCIARPTGYWTGEQVVSIATSAFGEERAQSLSYRFAQEEVLMKSAMQRPIFGWARAGGFNPPDASGKTAVTDGLWIIVFGWAGYVGLAGLNSMLLLPTILFMRRFPPKTWLDVDVAPLAALAMILPLFMLDNLSNAMLNPIYALAMGSLSACMPNRSSRETVSNPGHRSFDDQTLDVSAGSRHRFAPRAEHPDEFADRLETEALVAEDRDQWDEAVDLFRRSIKVRKSILTTRSSPDLVDRQAQVHVSLARLLTKLDQARPAIDERKEALALWRSLQGPKHRFRFSLDLFAANLNDLAWLLVADDQASSENIDDAVALAEEAVQIAANPAPFWNTLGVARYRRQDHYKAIHALSRSVSLSENGGTAFDFYYLALANHGLGYGKPAEDWRNLAERWVKQHPEFESLLVKVRTEVKNAIGDHEIRI